jgi:hypothetical protein
VGIFYCLISQEERMNLLSGVITSDMEAESMNFFDRGVV